MTRRARPCYFSRVEPSPFEELGGEAELRRIVDRFVDRMFEDVMIGFFFAHVDRTRLKQREFEFAARELGADIEYTGRPIGVAHGARTIFDGQFSRRLKLLADTLEEFAVPPRVREHWLSRTRALSDQVVKGPCQPADPSLVPR